jgi:anti-anti-sigma factor
VHENLSVSVRQQAGVTVVALDGILDTRSAAYLREQLTAAVHGSLTRPARILVDLGAVIYLDRDGLDCLLHIEAELAATADHLGLYEPHRASVVRLLHYADLDGAAWQTPLNALGPSPD